MKAFRCGAESKYENVWRPGTVFVSWLWPMEMIHLGLGSRPLATIDTHVTSRETGPTQVHP